MRGAKACPPALAAANEDERSKEGNWARTDIGAGEGSRNAEIVKRAGRVIEAVIDSAGTGAIERHDHDTTGMAPNMPQAA